MKKTMIGLMNHLKSPVCADCSSGKDKVRYALPEAREESTAKFELLTGDLLDCDIVSGIAVYGPYLIVTAYSQEQNKFVHIFDRQTGKRLKDVVHRGKLLFPVRHWFDAETGVMTYYDMMQSTVLTFQVDQIMADSEAIQLEDFNYPTRCHHYYRLGAYDFSENGISYLENATKPISRIQLIDASTRETISTYNEFPHYESDVIRYAANVTSHSALSPDRSKVALATCEGAVLELFNVKDEISPISVQYFVKPSLTPTGERTDEAIAGFATMTASSRYLYTVFDCKTKIKSYFSSEPITPIDNTLVIFDWHGKALRQIITDYRIEKICVDKEEKYLYAIIRDLDDRLYLGRISL